MNEKKCTNCGMPITGATYCSCQNELCYHCCECGPDCECGCDEK